MPYDARASQSGIRPVHRKASFFSPVLGKYRPRNAHTVKILKSPKLNHQMEKLKSVQYSAALAVTGAWKGTSRDKLYEELGWESLNLRRWSRRLVLFFKFVHNLAPENTREPTPPLPQSNYSLRRPAIIGQIRARTKSFGLSLYPNCLLEWKQI